MPCYDGVTVRSNHNTDLVFSSSGTGSIWPCTVPTFSCSLAQPPSSSRRNRGWRLAGCSQRFLCPLKHLLFFLEQMMIFSRDFLCPRRGKDDKICCWAGEPKEGNVEETLVLSAAVCFAASPAGSYFYGGTNHRIPGWKESQGPYGLTSPGRSTAYTRWPNILSSPILKSVQW